MEYDKAMRFFCISEDVVLSRPISCHCIHHTVLFSDGYCMNNQVSQLFK